MSKNKIIIHTDGSSLGNPGPGGWAAVLQSGDHEKEISGGYRKTTNNRMELMAVIEALKTIKKKSMEIDIHTDSNLIVNTINQGWMESWKKKGWKKSNKKPVLNQDLLMILDEQLKGLRVRFHWIKAHAGHPENERCDELAKAAAEKATEIDYEYEKSISDSNSLSAF